MKVGLVLFFTLITIFIFLLVVIALLIHDFYFENPEHTQKVSQGEIIVSNNIENFFITDPIVETLDDDYNVPDFSVTEEKLSNEEIIKDLPKSGNIRIGFYHFVQVYRKWDKIYSITKGEIIEDNAPGDIDLWLSSDYIVDLETMDLCTVVEKAQKNGDLGQSANIGKTKLLWKYSDLLKYRRCLGL